MKNKAPTIGFWIFTILFCLQMGFTAFAQLKLPQVAAEFAHIGIAPWFRIELSYAKFLGILALLIPQTPARVKEWAYCAFCITLISAIIAHLAVGEGFAQWSWAAFTLLLWLGSYFFWRRANSAVV